MSAPDTPHFNFPFAFSGSSVDTVEQDTLDDITNCVKVILLTHVGFRSEVPSFGVPDFTFIKQPIGRDFILALIAEQEPRAALMIREAPDVFDNLIDHILVEVGTKGGSQ